MEKNIKNINDLMNLKEAAAKTGYCVQHLRRLAKSGKVPCLKRGAYYFFSEDNISEILGVPGNETDKELGQTIQKEDLGDSL